MNWEFDLLKKLGITVFIATSLGSFGSLKAIAETVEVSGGGKCEGSITADNLNGKVVCTYSNGDRFEGQFVYHGYRFAYRRQKTGARNLYFCRW